MLVNFSKVANGIYRCARPQTVEDFKELKARGIGAVIGLEEYADPESEFAKCREAGLRFIHLPMSNFFRPEVEELRRIAWYMKVYTPSCVHCLWGKDRTGFAVAAYRILYCGWSVEEAYVEAKVHGHRHIVYFFWKKSLQELAQTK